MLATDRDTMLSLRHRVYQFKSDSLLFKLIKNYEESGESGQIHMKDSIFRFKIFDFLKKKKKKLKIEFVVKN